MTETIPSSPPAEGDDQAPYEFQYDHARMPTFMKVIWLGFLTFATWYTVTYLLEALGTEISA